MFGASASSVESSFYEHSSWSSGRRRAMPDLSKGLVAPNRQLGDTVKSTSRRMVETLNGVTRRADFLRTQARPPPAVPVLWRSVACVRATLRPYRQKPWCRFRAASLRHWWQFEQRNRATDGRRICPSPASTGSTRCRDARDSAPRLLRSTANRRSAFRFVARRWLLSTIRAKAQTQPAPAGSPPRLPLPWHPACQPESAAGNLPVPL